MTKKGTLALPLSALAILLNSPLPLFAQSPTVLPLPAVTEPLTGAIAGSFDVNDGGGATYKIPLEVPPGTMGLVPHLALEYDSHRTASGTIGVGWGMTGLSAITRCPRTISQDGYARGVGLLDSDALCLDGQRMVQTGSGPGYIAFRTENDSFSEITQFGPISGPGGPGFFWANQKDGMQAQFAGGDGAGVTSVPPPLPGFTPRVVMSWQLNRLKDRNNNALTVAYDQNIVTGESVPTRIDYTHNLTAGRLVAYNSVRFTYLEKDFPERNFSAGYPFGSTKLISKISMYAGEDLAWEYNLEYSSDPITLEDRLIRVTQCAAPNSDGSLNCVNPTEFKYGSPEVTQLTYQPLPALDALGYSRIGPPPTPSPTPTGTPIPSFIPNEDTRPMFVGDWNGDGKADVARAYGALGGVVIGSYLSQGPAGFTPYAVTQLSSRTSLVVNGDWNADGRTDFAAYIVGGNRIDFYLSSGTGFAFDRSLHVSGEPSAIIAGDWNADVRSDIALVAGTGVMTYLNNGAGFDPFVVINDLSAAQGFTNPTSYPIYGGDWNGDGLSDIARMGPTGVKFYVANNTGFSVYATLTQFPGAADVRYPILVGDWNGDGSTDVGRVMGSSTLFCFSKGTGFEDCFPLADFSPAQGYVNDVNSPIISVDLNGDGASDIARIRSSDGRVISYLSKDGIFVGPYDTIGALPADQSGDFANVTFPVFEGDWNGDGFVGLGRDGNFALHFYSPASSNTTELVEIDNGLGRVTQVTYAPLTDNSVYEKGSDAVYPQIDVVNALRVVKEFRSSNGLGGFSRGGYFYRALRSDLLGRGVSGFESIDATDYDQGTVTQSTYRQDFPFRGLRTLSEVRLTNPQQTLINRQTISWDVRNLTTGTYFLYAPETSEESFEPNSNALISRVVKSSTYDDLANLLMLDVRRSDGSWEQTVNTYSQHAAIWDKVLTSATVTAGNSHSPAQTRSSEFNLGANLTETIEPASSTLRLVRSRVPSYSDFGNIYSTSTTGPGIAGRYEYKSYDPQGRFVTSTTNALGQVSHMTSEPFRGRLASSTDANGIITRWSYDALGREQREFRPDGTESRTLVLAPGNDAPPEAAYQRRTDSSGAPPQIIFFDSLDREIQRRTLGFDGRMILIDTVHNQRGEITHQSQPYFRGENPLWTIREYDSIGRQIRLIEPGVNGTRQTATEYDGLTTIVINALGQRSSTTTDIVGRTIRSTDSQGNVLSLFYDGFGKLKSTVDSKGNTTTISYDQRGNKISISDPNSGITRYTYNILGETLTETNAKDETITSTYDKLGRLIRRQRPEGVEEWIYDTAAHGIGKLARVTGPNGFEQRFTYDTLSRPVSTTTRINGEDFTVGISYDQYGRQVQTQYPSGFATRNVYNSFGYWSETRRFDTNQLYWRATKRNAQGQLEQQLFGNGLKTDIKYQPTSYISSISTGAVQSLSFVFDDLGNLIERGDRLVGVSEQFRYDTLNRLTWAKVSSSRLEPVTLKYDVLGNITYKSDTGKYQYRDRAHIHAVTAIEGPRANNYAYDAAGNRISSRNGSVHYDSGGRPISIIEGATEMRFAVDPSGNRYSENTLVQGTLRESKIILGEVYERIREGDRTKHLHYLRGADGVIALLAIDPTLELATHTVAAEPLSLGKNVELRRINESVLRARQSEILRYFHRDHLDSIQTITNEQGSVVEVSSYDAWGVRRDPVTWEPVSRIVKSSVDRGFTNHEHLDDVRLIHMNGRVYDPFIGRFISPDPFIQDPTNQQSLNRYSYVLNNPLSLTDPSGFFFKKLWKRMLRFLRKVIAIAITVAVAYVSGLAFSSVLGNGFLASGISAAGANISSSIVQSVMHGGSVRDGWRAGLRSAPLSMLEGIFTYWIGEAPNASRLEKAAAHGIVGGGLSMARGGNFQSGFFGSFVSKMSSGQSVMGSVLLGGTASAVSGGRFTDGALRSTFIYLYNDLGSAFSGTLGEATRNGAIGWRQGMNGSVPYPILPQDSSALDNFGSFLLNGVDAIGGFVSQYHQALWDGAETMSEVTAHAAGPIKAPVAVIVWSLRTYSVIGNYEAHAGSYFQHYGRDAFKEMWKMSTKKQPEQKQR